MEKAKSEIKILNFNTSTEGGAALAAIAFNNMLNNMGYQSKLLVYDLKTKHENVFEVPGKSFFSFLKRIPKRKKRKLERNKSRFLSKHGFSFKIAFGINQEPYSAEYLLERVDFIPDIIIYHWVQDFISVRNMSKMSDITGARSVWMMMDNAPFTGGCHYPFDCLGYQSGCSLCPLFTNYLDLPSRVFLQKQMLLPENMYVAGTSGDCMRAKRSICFKPEQIHPFLFPVDEKKYVLGNRIKARELLQIPVDKKIVLIGASDFQEERKGLGFLIAALTLFNDKYQDINGEVVLLIAGVNVPEVFCYLGYQVVSTGRLDEDQLITAYQSADLFLNASVEDSGPLMINQSMMCGTPVVTFELGVAYDLVISGETGYRAKMKDVEDLAVGIHSILVLSEEKSEEMSIRCRRHIIDQTDKIGIVGLVDRIFNT